MIPQMQDSPQRRKILAALAKEPEYEAARNALRQELQRDFERWQAILGKDLPFHNVVSEWKEKWFNVAEKILILEFIASGRLPGVTFAEFRQSAYPSIQAEAQDWQLTKEQEKQLDHLQDNLAQYEGQDLSGDETMQRWMRRSQVMLEVQRNYIRDSYRYLGMLRS